MTAEGIVLEMTDAAQLRPSPRHTDLTLSGLPVRQSGRIASLYRTIWQPIGGGGRSSWTEQEWATELNQPGMAAWVAQIDGEDVGMAQLGWSGHGDAAIVVIGIIPVRRGNGIGGDFLTRLTELMWLAPAPNGRPTHRVWLWTVPDEHPHTIPNYTARGFERGPDLA